MALIDLLERNRTWAAAQIAEDPEFFARHLQGQHPRLLWIGCSDSRVPPEQIMGSKPGEMFVHRNVANIVAYNDINIAAAVQFAIDYLKIEDIVVCGHYGCGGVTAACQDNIVGGYIGDWLMIVTWAKRAVNEFYAREDARPPTGDEFLRMVVEENVRLQIRHLSRISVVRTHWESNTGVPRLHGWVYDMRDGTIKVLVDGKDTPLPVMAASGNGNQ